MADRDCRNNDRDCGNQDMRPILDLLNSIPPSAAQIAAYEAMSEFLRRDEVTAMWIDEEVGPEFERFAKDFVPPAEMMVWTTDELGRGDKSIG